MKTERKPNVLIVDDDPDILLSIQIILEDEGLSVLGASNGEDALNLIHEKGLPQLIILDMKRVKPKWTQGAATASSNTSTIPGY